MMQQELPIALVRGERVVEKPQDLFIPSRALEIQLKEFEGPLDFLLYLIKKQKFDIVDLPISPITTQYFEYLESVEEQGIELAAEYLLMAATLAQIKSKMLLPKQIIEDEEVDPRAELVRKLQEYELMKRASELLEELPQSGRDYHVADVLLADNLVKPEQEYDLGLSQLVSAFQEVLSRQAAFEHHHIEKESISTKDKIEQVLLMLASDATTYHSFHQLLVLEQGRVGVIVTFLAILELVKEERVLCRVGNENEEFGIRIAA